jgi:hypothetical protein
VCFAFWGLQRNWAVSDLRAALDFRISLKSNVGKVTPLPLLYMLQNFHPSPLSVGYCFTTIEKADVSF